MKVVLVDGNNLMFRSYYATLYTGNTMRNKEGFPTNALYGFVNMINKIINEEKPSYIMVAFDIGKTFRHLKYDYYKGTRDNTPEDLKVQFPIAKKILTAMGIKYLEKEGYESDDIIGTLSRMCEENDNYEALIVSSDKDLLQLIGNSTTVKLLKPKDYIFMTKDEFMKTYGIEPIRMIDLKSLMGDSSDNIPGVKGIGEKTALKLLIDYGSLDGVYENIDKIKGSTHDKLINDKDNAYMSYDIATIDTHVPLDLSLEDIKYNEEDTNELINIYNDLEFYSFLKNINSDSKIEIKNVKNDKLDNIKIDGNVSVYFDLDNNNYHNAKLLGIGLYNENISTYIEYTSDVDLSFLRDVNILTYDYKRLYVTCIKNNIPVPKCIFDTMIAAYLLNYTLKDDISYLMQEMDCGVKNTDADKVCIEKCMFIYNTYNILHDKMISEDILSLYSDIEFPLSIVLSKMELNGIRVDTSILEKMKGNITDRISEVSNNIYSIVGHEFNIGSPRQLGEVLFEELKLPFGKKNKTGYSTDSSVLTKLSEYEIVRLITEYRMLNKLYSTYIEGILNSVSSDGKIHTIYTQVITRTGRLSSIEPNLQNIPIRYEMGKLIRKAFIPENDSLLMSSDYSQVELRVFAHLSNVNELVEAFNNDMDIHSKTAMDIFHVPLESVTKDMRRSAKAVNFGILYGISSYGLSEDLGIRPREAKEFIDKYFMTYPGVRDYMNREIEEAKKNGYVKTIMNRKRVIPELSSSNHVVQSMGERMALNTPIQGSSADILKMAMIAIDREFQKENIKSTMLLQVHDELIFNVINSEKNKVKEIVSNIMEGIIKLNVPLKVDIEFGSDWYEAK